MKRKFLEALGLEKETIDKIIDQNSQDIGGFKRQVDELTNTNKQLMEDVTTRDTQLQDLRKAGSVEDLQKKIDDLTADNERIKQEKEDALRDIKYDTAIEKALASAKHIDLVSDKIKREKLKLNKDGSVDGLDEQVSELKKIYSDLFEPSKRGKSPKEGDEPTEKKPEEKSYEDFVNEIEDAE